METTIHKIGLPECTIARAGFHLSSQYKDLTVILLPFERFSSLGKAVDELYRAIPFPFRLLVVEGNAPDSVRAELEMKQRKHRSMMLIYCDRFLSMGGLLNRAIPHVKTKYVLVLDADMRLVDDAATVLLRCAMTKNYPMLCPKNCIVPRKVRFEDETEVRTKAIPGLGIRTCFLIALEALEKLGKLDEISSPLTGGLDFFTTVLSQVKIGIAAQAFAESRADGPLSAADSALYRFQWSRRRITESLRHFEKKWGMALQEPHYERLVELKQNCLQKEYLFEALFSRQARFQRRAPVKKAKAEEKLAVLQS